MEMVTKAEREQLEQRLAALIANRPVISARIAEARAHGDLRENGDYHAAREQQGMDEAEIRRLQERLSNMSVIDERMTKALHNTVFIGCTVKLHDEQFGDDDLYKLVGESSGRFDSDEIEVTISSPMGEALLKARVGDVVKVDLPRGTKRFEVVQIL